MHWILAPAPAPSSVTKILAVEDLLYSQQYLEADNKTHWLQTKLVTSPESINEIADITAGQRNNMLWAVARKLRITSSVFGPVLKAIDRDT